MSTQPKRIGRPPIPVSKRSNKRPRSIRLSVQHWDKLKHLGTKWLERAIEEA